MKFLRSIRFLFLVLVPLRGNAQTPPPSDSSYLLEKTDAWMENLPQRPPKDTTLPFIQPMERLLVSPTAFGLKKNERDYRNLSVFYNSFHKGFTDKITVGIGFMPLIVTNFLWVDAKRTIRISPNVHAGIGVLAGGAVLTGFGDGPDFGGILGGFGVLTIGSKRNFINLTASRMTGRAYGDWEPLPWLVTLGNSFEVSKNLRVFCEVFNETPTYNEWLIAVGMSAMSKKKRFDGAIIYFPYTERLVLPGLALAVRY